MENIKLFIINKDSVQIPLVLSGITVTSDRIGTASELNFDILKDETLDFVEGNVVQLIVDGYEFFKGYVFTKSRNRDGIISVVAYDQMRYLKNKDTIKYTDLTASEVLELLCRMYELQVGNIDSTNFKIENRNERNQTLFDIIYTALDLTLENTGEMYVLYDNFGKISLSNISNLAVDYIINEDNVEDFSYISSIDKNTYTQIKLLYEDDENSTDTPYYAIDENNIKEWGILQYFDTVQNTENGQLKADTLLKLYNQKTRNLEIKGAFGDVRVKAGCLIAVNLNLGDIIVNNMMLVEKCKHEFTENQHTMDLTIIGGEFVG